MRGIPDKASLQFFPDDTAQNVVAVDGGITGAAVAHTKRTPGYWLRRVPASRGPSVTCWVESGISGAFASKRAVQHHRGEACAERYARGFRVSCGWLKEVFAPGSGGGVLAAIRDSSSVRLVRVEEADQAFDRVVVAVSLTRDALVVGRKKCRGAR